MAFEVAASRTAYDGVMTRIRVDDVRMPDGQVVEREVAVHDDAVAVVAVDDRQRVVLVRQYRHAMGGYLLELPAGLLDVAGEERQVAARRELAEEVGLEAGELVELVTFANSAGWSEERTTIYLATQVRPVERPAGFVLDAEEADMQTMRVAVDEAVARVRRGELVDAKTVIGILLAAERLRTGPATAEG